MGWLFRLFERFCHYSNEDILAVLKTDPTLNEKPHINFLLLKIMVVCYYETKDCKLHSFSCTDEFNLRVDFGEVFSTKPSISNGIIWNNKLIKIDCKRIYCHNYTNAPLIIMVKELATIRDGIILCNQMSFLEEKLKTNFLKKSQRFSDTYKLLNTALKIRCREISFALEKKLLKARNFMNFVSQKVLWFLGLY